VLVNRIRLGGLIYSLESFLQLNMCRELQIFAFVYMYSGASQVFLDLLLLFLLFSTFLVLLLLPTHFTGVLISP
jgi:hypothetical protein